MTFFTEMADTVRELLGPGEDSFGEQFKIVRPAAAGYDPATRTKTPGQPIEMDGVWGTMDTDLVPVGAPDTLVARYQRVLYAVPETGAGKFTPGQNDRVVADTTYQIEETGHVIKQGVPILWICGLVST